VKNAEIVLGQEGKVMLGSPKDRTDHERTCPHSNNCIRFSFGIAYFFCKNILTFAEIGKPLIKLVQKSHKQERKERKKEAKLH